MLHSSLLSMQAAVEEELVGWLLPELVALIRNYLAYRFADLPIWSSDANNGIGLVRSRDDTCVTASKSAPSWDSNLLYPPIAPSTGIYTIRFLIGSTRAEKPRAPCARPVCLEVAWVTQTFVGANPRGCAYFEGNNDNIALDSGGQYWFGENRITLHSGGELNDRAFDTDARHTRTGDIVTTRYDSNSGAIFFKIEHDGLPFKRNEPCISVLESNLARHDHEDFVCVTPPSGPLVETMYPAIALFHETQFSPTVTIIP